MFSSYVSNRSANRLKKQELSEKEIFYSTYQQLAGKMYSLCLRYSGSITEAQYVFTKGMSLLFNESKTHKGSPLTEQKARHIFVKCNIDHLPAKERELFNNLPLFISKRKIILENLESYTEAELVLRISQLPTPYRIVFNLYLVENYSIDSICKLLDITKITATSLLNKSKLLFMENPLKTDS